MKPLHEFNEPMLDKDPLGFSRYLCEHCEKSIPQAIDGGPYLCSGWHVCYLCKEEFEEGFWPAHKGA